jgi:uncharacterized membrane protein
MKHISPFWLAPLALLALAGCGASDSAQAPDAGTVLSEDDSRSTAPFDGIASDEVVQFLGTEPFWGGQASGTTLVYSTPEDPEGTEYVVRRFAGRGGLSFSGTMGEAPFEMMVTPLRCSDGMSDRTYPYTVTLQIGQELRSGCGWTETRPFEGPQAP